MNTSYKLKMQTLSPVHIGAGSEKYWQKGLDYFYKSKKLFILNQKKIFMGLSPQERSQWNSSMAAGKGGEFLERYFSGRKPEDYSDFVYDCSIFPQDDIRSIIRNGMGQPYIPGSSIKGAIRSALFSHFFHEMNIPLFKFDQREGRDRPKGADELEKDIFGDISNNLMHFLQVSDVSVDQKHTGVFQTKTFNLHNEQGTWLGGWKHALRGDNTTEFSPKGFVFTYECIQPDITIAQPLILSFDTDLMKLQQRKNNNHEFFSLFLSDNPLEELFKIINRFTVRYIEREIEFFREFPDDSQGNEAFIELLQENILKSISGNNNSCVFRFAHGAGFHSITGDWKFNNHLETIEKPDAGSKRYKSRKTVFDIDEDEYVFDLLGFIKLTLV